MAGIAIRELDSRLSFGARVSGVSHEALKNESVREQLRRQFRQCGVIVFEGVEPSPETQVAISTVFGPLKDHPVASVERADSDKLLGVIAISSGPQAGIVEIDGKQLATWQPWHFDHAYNNELNYAGVLRPVTIAQDGGQTAFADGVQICRDMNPDILRKAEGVEVLYNLDLRYDRQRFGLPDNFRVIRLHESQLDDGYGQTPNSVHPAVWTRDSGERVFHMTPYGCRGILRDSVRDDSDAAFELLAEIWAEAMRVIKPYYHSWRADDMVIWDNHRVLHQATGCDPDEYRMVHRTTIKGDYGHGRWELDRPQAA